MDLSTTTTPDSTQVNADDLIGGPRTVTISGVREGTAEQPVNIDLVEIPDRTYRPGKSMRRVLVAAWGPDSAAYIGQRMTLYCDPEISFGRDKVGGIRIAAMSGIKGTLKIALTVTRGSRKPFIVEPLTESAPTAAPSLMDRIDKMVTAFSSQGIDFDQLEQRVGTTRDNWTADDIAAMTIVYGQLTKDGMSKDELFPTQSDTFPNEPTMDGE